MQKIEFGTVLRSVGFAALRNCDSLLSLTLPFIGQTGEENRFLGYLFGASAPSLARGFYPPFLRELVLLPGCTSLADQAISDCVSLQTVVIPEGLTTVGARTFSGCTALETVSFPASLRTLGDGAFSGCIALTGITFSEGLTGIGMNAFYGCRSLVSVSFPQTLTELPPSCFAACRSLAEVDLGGVLTVGKDCFADCPSISSVRGLGRQGMTVREGNDAILTVKTEKI